MIHFEIIQSPDFNVQTSFKFIKNEIYIGRRAGDLNIIDSGLRDSHLMIEIPEDQLLVHPQRDVEYYLLNGKRATSIRKLKIGDTIQIGQTVLKIIEFSRTEFPSKKDILNQKLNQLIESGSPRISVIETLTKMMK